VKIVTLTQGQVALVDDEDFERASKFKWQAHRTGPNCSWRVKRGVYNPNTQNNENEYLHNFIMQSPGIQFDHRDGNGLNNQKYNLRPASSTQNNRAFRRKSVGKTSKYRGVFFNTQAGKWHARITVADRPIHCGYFSIEEDAAKAYDAAAKKYFGEFAAPNFK
jgi:hypothetical protein